MRKLRLSSRRVEAFLEEKGFMLVRQKGSHKQYVGVAAGAKRFVTVPTGRSDLLPGTLSSIIRQSGIEKSVWQVEA